MALQIYVNFNGGLAACAGISSSIKLLAWPDQVHVCACVMYCFSGCIISQGNVP